MSLSTGAEARLEYHPERERLGNWVPTMMGRRYDALLSFDTTEALHPLHPEKARVVPARRSRRPAVRSASRSTL